MSVAVKSGAYEEIGDLAGMTIGEIREQYEAPWNIDPEAIAMVNNSEMSDDHVIEDGQKIEFVRSESKWF